MVKQEREVKRGGKGELPRPPPGIGNAGVEDIPQPVKVKVNKMRVIKGDIN